MTARRCIMLTLRQLISNVKEFGKVVDVKSGWEIAIPAAIDAADFSERRYKLPTFLGNYRDDCYKAVGGVPIREVLTTYLASTRDGAGNMHHWVVCKDYRNADEVTVCEYGRAHSTFSMPIKYLHLTEGQKAKLEEALA